MINKIAVVGGLNKLSKDLKRQAEAIDELKTVAEVTPIEQLPSLLSGLPDIKFSLPKRQNA